jgi:hypothetical protein
MDVGSYASEARSSPFLFTTVKEEIVQIGNELSFCYNNGQSKIGDGVRRNCYSG